MAEEAAKKAKEAAPQVVTEDLLLAAQAACGDGVVVTFSNTARTQFRVSIGGGVVSRQRGWTREQMLDYFNYRRDQVCNCSNVVRRII